MHEGVLLSNDLDLAPHGCPCGLRMMMVIRFADQGCSPHPEESPTSMSRQAHSEDTPDDSLVISSEETLMHFDLEYRGTEPC